MVDKIEPAPVDIPRADSAGVIKTSPSAAATSQGILDASDDDPQDPVEKIIIRRGYPEVVMAKELFKYFKSRESKKTTKSVLMYLISQLPWLIYLILTNL